MAFDAFALILTMLGLGMLFARLRLLPDNTAEALNRIVLYVCLPAAVLTYVPRLHVDASVLGIAATPWLLALATLALVTLATRLFGLRLRGRLRLLHGFGLLGRRESQKSTDS